MLPRLPRNLEHYKLPSNVVSTTDFFSLQFAKDWTLQNYIMFHQYPASIVRSNYHAELSRIEKHDQGVVNKGIRIYARKLYHYSTELRKSVINSYYKCKEKTTSGPSVVLGDYVNGDKMINNQNQTLKPSILNRIYILTTFQGMVSMTKFEFLQMSSYFACVFRYLDDGTDDSEKYSSRVMKRKPISESEYEDDDIDDNYESEEEEEEEEDDDDDDDENKTGSGNGDVDKDIRAKIDKNAFRQAYEKIPETSKLKLSSGKVVEEVLFNYIKNSDYEHHAHSYIINYDDQEIRELFSEEEWKELTKDQLGIPVVPLDIAKEVSKYGNKDLKELREAIMTSYLPRDVPYDHNQHYDLEWIHMAIRTIVNLYENDDSPLQRNHYEYWYTIALFGACIDFAFNDSRLGTSIKRSEVGSYASSNRKNRTKITKGRKLTGRKIDGIIYLIENLHEMGAIEDARFFAGVHDKKYLQEFFKMPKTLRDILADLIRVVDYDDKKISKIQIFGIIHLGLKIQFSRLWRAGGSITIFKKDPPLYEISIYQYKMILKNNIQALNIFEEDNVKEDATEDTLLDELLRVGRQTPPPSTINYFADCFTTPKKPTYKKREDE
ncbi:hypothetical protein G9A89_022205 [Geosiphon pyriformis]|nr:hypothetical protein G9A89_022205 [Geosiphon pyriformis]